jgi:hypothetical protein
MYLQYRADKRQGPQQNTLTKKRTYPDTKAAYENNTMTKGGFYRVLIGIYRGGTPPRQQRILPRKE